MPGKNQAPQMHDILFENIMILYLILTHQHQYFGGTLRCSKDVRETLQQFSKNKNKKGTKSSRSKVILIFSPSQMLGSAFPTKQINSLLDETLHCPKCLHTIADLS